MGLVVWLGCRSKCCLMGWVDLNTIKRISCLVTAIVCLPVFAQNADNAEALFENFQNRLYQIRTIDIASGSKSSIGSAFAINEQGVLATNYHVVSNKILHPEKYSLSAIDWQQKPRAIEVLQVDVVNDLALVKFTEQQNNQFLKISSKAPEKGEQIYSLGNPRDLGMTVVPGTYNGITAHSYYDRVLFSGSINPGMSGGPVLNHQGDVIGVNVATSGNQISFLVPVNHLEQLILRLNVNSNKSLPEDRSAVSHKPPLIEQAYQQLKDNQQQLMRRLIDGNWQTATLGKSEVVGELDNFISCWGESRDSKDDKFKEIFRRCRNKEYVYIAPDFYTGTVEMEFYWYQTDRLTSWQFYRMLNDSFGSVSAGNRAGEEHVTEYSCATDFVEQSQLSTRKMVYCVREYKQFQGLFDVLFLSATVNQQHKSLVSHYTLAGVSQENAQQFLTQFMERVK